MSWSLGYWRANKPNSGWTTDQVSDLIFYCIIGVVAGGRLGYILFYDVSSLVHDPLFAVKLWQPGMSFHGGLMGVVLAFFWFSHKSHQTITQHEHS